MADGSMLVVEIARGTLARVRPDGALEVVADCGGAPTAPPLARTAPSTSATTVAASTGKGSRPHSTGSPPRRPGPATGRCNVDLATGE